MLLSLLASPLLGPVKLVDALARTVLERAEMELYDEGAIRAELAAVELAYDAGKIDEAARDAAEDALLDRLREARARAQAP